MNNDLQYIKYDFGTGWPAGPELFYLCQRCGDLIPSTEDGQCRCGNIFVDASAGRAGADDESKVQLVKKIVGE